MGFLQPSQETIFALLQSSRLNIFLRNFLNFFFDSICFHQLDISGFVILHLSILIFQTVFHIPDFEVIPLFLFQILDFLLFSLFQLLLELLFLFHSFLQFVLLRLLHLFPGFDNRPRQE